MRIIRSWRLGTKVLAGVLVVLSVVFASLIAVLSTTQRAALERQLAGKGENLVRILSGIALEPLLANNFAYLEDTARDVGKDTDVAYVVVLDGSSNPVTRAFTEPADKAGLLTFAAEVHQGTDSYGHVRLGLRTSAIDAAVRRSQLVVTLLGLGAMAVVTLFVLLIFRSVVLRGIESVRSTLGRVAAGQIGDDVEASGDDEIALVHASLGEMVRRVRTVVSEVKSAGESVLTASQAMAASTAQMSRGATEQATSTQEASSSIARIASQIQLSADAAAQTERIAAETAQAAMEGGRVVGETVAAMKAIADRISIIDELAYQTNLLALNASIEAARAGQHGRGFAVVGAEVRRLAERSREAAKEIGELSSSTVALAENAGNVLQEIVPAIQRTAGLVADVTAASRGQSADTSQLSRAIEQLDRVTQQNAAAAEELSATAEELAAHAQALQESVAYFRTEGRTDAAPSAGAAELPAHASA